MVGVAQLVEPRIVIPVVVGSSPIVHPTFTSLGPIQYNDEHEIDALKKTQDNR